MISRSVLSGMANLLALFVVAGVVSQCFMKNGMSSTTAAEEQVSLVNEPAIDLTLPAAVKYGSQRDLRAKGMKSSSSDCIPLYPTMAPAKSSMMGSSSRRQLKMGSSSTGSSTGSSSASSPAPSFFCSDMPSTSPSVSSAPSMTAAPTDSSSSMSSMSKSTMSSSSSMGRMMSSSSTSAPTVSSAPTTSAAPTGSSSSMGMMGSSSSMMGSSSRRN